MTDTTLPLVTISIPTFNRADGYLRNAIECALGQTYRNIEVIVSDNCSTDNTEKVVRGFDDPRIRYFRHSVNIGANNNFNFCVQQAKGAYFLLLHDDDLIDNDFIEACVRAVNYSVDVGLIRTGMRRIDCQGNKLADRPNFAGGLPTKDFFLCWFRGETPMHLCMSLFNTRYLRETGGFNSKHQLFQDVLAEVTLAARAGRCDIEDVKASYRMHADQISCSARIRDWCEDSLFLHAAMCELIPQDRKQLECEGKKFFFRHNYTLARKIRSMGGRLGAYMLICHYFGYLYSIRQIVRRNALDSARLMKRMVTRIAMGIKLC